MLNISNRNTLIIGCSAVALLTIGSMLPANAAETTNNSNSSSTNVTTTNGGGVGIGGSSGSPSPGVISRATALSNSVSVAQTNYTQAATALAQAEAVQAPVSDTTPIRYGREVADLASCGCPNADTTASNTTTPRPELVAARAAEAEAATQLANAKAEARQFIESVKGGNTAGQAVVSQLW